MNDAIEQFRSAIRSAGLEPPEIIEADGRLHRFPTNGRVSDDAGWYVLHDDSIPAGMFGDFRTGVKRNWRADIGRPLTVAEGKAHCARRAAIRRTREADDVRRGKAAKATTAEVVEVSALAADDNPYLTRKRLSPVATLRELDAGEAAEILGYAPKSRGKPLTGRLLVVPVEVGSELRTLEFIDEAGRKSALYGGAKAGGYWAAQPLPDGDGTGLTLLIGEGVATVLSAKEATGNPSIAALSCGNLPAVAREMRERYPVAVPVILADLMKATGEPDPHAVEAARAIGGLLAFPDFGENRPEGATDFNDLAAHRGLEAVRAAIASAEAPGGSENQTWADMPLVDGPREARGGAPHGTHQSGYGEPSAGNSASPEWPLPMDLCAYYGLPGEIVKALDPHTESDPVAILVQVLVAFGVLIGRSPYVQVEGDRHYANLFGLLIGGTSKGRKGTSWGRVRSIFGRIPGWPRVVSGLSSGEGLKFQVRDPDDRLPAETRWVLDQVQLRLRSAVEHHVKPIVVLQAIRRLVLVITDRDLANGDASFHLDEAHVGEGLGVMRVRFPRDEIEAAVVLLYAFNHPAAFGFVANRLLDGNPLNLLVTHHGCDARGCTLGVRQHPGAAEVLDVADGQVALHGQLDSPPLEAVVQLIEMGLRLCDVALEARDVLALDAAVRQIGKRHVGAMDQLSEGDLEVPGDGLDLARTLGGDLLEGLSAFSTRACSTRARSGMPASLGTGVPTGAKASAARYVG